MACFFVFLTVLDEKKFKILMDLIWADASTEFEAPPFWLFCSWILCSPPSSCGGPELGPLAVQIRGVLFGIESLCVVLLPWAKVIISCQETASDPTG